MGLIAAEARGEQTQPGKGDEDDGLGHLLEYLMLDKDSGAQQD